MVTALAGNHVCYNSILSQKVLVAAYDRSSCILVSRNERTKYLKSRVPHLNSLEKLILSVYLLETDDFVVFNGLPETFELELFVSLRRKNRPNETPSVSQRERKVLNPSERETAEKGASTRQAAKKR